MLLQNAYLYSRIYYSKIRDTTYQWWRTYLLFKCCILVVPIYTSLLLIGLYCILNNIDVQSSLKTIYELLILLFSAAAIFIIVLLLATLNGSYAHSPHGDYDPDTVIISSLSSSARRNYNNDNFHFTDTSYQRQNMPATPCNNNNSATSITSTIISTLFGTINDPEDPDCCYDSDFDDISTGNLQKFDQNLSQTRLNSELETNALAEFLERYPRNDENNFDEDDTISQDIIANPLLNLSKCSANNYSYPTLISPLSKNYKLSNALSPSYSYIPLINSESKTSEYIVTLPEHSPRQSDFPPSYEEAIQSDYHYT